MSFFLLSTPFLFNYILPHQSKIHMKEPTQFLIKKKKTTQFINEERCQNTTAVFPSVIPHKLCSCLIFQSQIPNQFHWLLSSTCSLSYPQMKQSKSQAGFRISHWVQVWHNSIFVKSIPTWDSNHILSFYLLSSTVWNWVWWNWVCGLCIYNEFVFWTFCSLRNFIKHNKGSKHSKLAAAKNLHNKHKD